MERPEACIAHETRLAEALVQQSTAGGPEPSSVPDKHVALRFLLGQHEAGVIIGVSSIGGPELGAQGSCWRLASCRGQSIGCIACA
jgi:hypothetical protein